MKYHLTEQGPKPCKATKRSCPLGGSEVHFESRELAESAFEERLKQEHALLPKRQAAKSITGKLLQAGAGRYPEAIMEQLGAYLESRPSRPLMVMPGGSDLYNTKIPGRAVHDYDFTVFGTPTDHRKKIHQHLAGELDVTTVEVTEVAEVMRRSTPMTEAFFGLRAGRSLAIFQDAQWGPYLHSMRYPTEKYFDLLDDVIKSHSDVFQEPVFRETDPKGFKDFKHIVRWHLYQERWGRGSEPFDPRLSEEERARWLSVLQEGMLARFRTRL